ncbi:MAG: Z-ring formation inhibitor MciZ [Clostridia bacterium]|nr:Z-ring formation inhibitor MciZ [Clostridia bacterium]
MKVYVNHNRIFFVGKVFQLRKYLSDYALKYATVKEMITKSLN